MYAASAPCWWAALRRTRRKLFGRTLPLLSLFAAFSFVTMMFNLPLPGGTTGHAVGVGIAAIVLGPWASLLAISLALTIQALFFGDGGITTLGANCFNMAIAGSFAAWGIYRLVSLGAAADSRRRVVAAALAGYGAINLSALLAAIEFGIQPMLFHDATGAPLYAPYPLQNRDSGDDGRAFDDCRSGRGGDERGTVQLSAAQRTGAGGDWRAAGLSRACRTPAALGAGRGLWGALAVVLLLTPLGILASGAAWGEWAPKDFANAAARAQIAAASGNAAPPVAVPSGLARLANLWTAPMPDYAPHFVKSAAFGYLLSAMFGVGLILAVTWLVQRASHAAKRRADRRKAEERAMSAGVIAQDGSRDLPRRWRRPWCRRTRPASTDCCRRWTRG